MLYRGISSMKLPVKEKDLTGIKWALHQVNVTVVLSIPSKTATCQLEKYFKPISQILKISFLQRLLK